MPSAPIHAHAAQSPAANDDFAHLERTEQLIVWTLRAIAIGHGECPTLRQMFRMSFGQGADDAFLGFFVTVRTLGWCGRRKLRLHVPGCMAVSADERTILGLFAEAQASLSTGDETRVRTRLADLVDSRATEAVLLSLQTVASALEVGGYAPARPAADRPVDVTPRSRPETPRLLH